MADRTFKDVVLPFQILSDLTRLRIVNLLLHKDLSVWRIGDVLFLQQPTVSQHLRRLRDAGFVSVSKNGQKRIYCIARNTEFLRSLWAAVELWAHETAELRNDLKVLGP
jgi:DNA-binding transcriptional ArsR family regulator